MSNTIGSHSGLTRRNFLKGSAAAAGALGLAGAGGMLSADGWLAPASAHAEPEEKIGYTFHYRHCQCNCHLKCTVRDGRMVLVEPNTWPDKNNETICLKGISEIQHTYSTERIQTPLKRVGERGAGEFVAITWEEALDTVAEKIKETREKYGYDAVCLQSAVDALSTNLAKILRGQEKPHRGIDIGLGNGFSPAIAESGQQGAASHEIKDWKNAKTILNVGCNSLETCMVTARYFFEAKEAGAEIISIDPNFCTTAAKSSRWIPINAGTDSALYLGMISIILDNEWFDAPYLKAYTSMPFLVSRADGSMLREAPVADIAQPGIENPFMVWDAASASLKPYNAEGVDPELVASATVDGVEYVTVFTLLKENQAPYTVAWAAEQTGIAEEVLLEITEKYACNGPSILSFGFGGGEKFYDADVSGHAAVVLATLIGSFGTDIPGRGAGAYVNAYQKIFGAGKLAGWKLPEEYATAKAPKESVDYRDEHSKIKLLWIQNGALQQIGANQNRTNEWAKNLDFIVAQDIWHTPSVDWADIVLPVCSHFECIEEVGAIRALRGHVLLQQKVLDPLFESKTDFWIECELAKRLGCGDLMPASHEALTRHQLEKSEDAKLAGITLDAVIAANGVVALNDQPEIARSYSGYKFNTTSGRIDLYYEKLTGYGQALPTFEGQNEVREDNPLKEQYPLNLLQRRTKYHIHQNFVDGTWVQQFYTPTVDINPIDAEARGLKSGDVVEVFNDRGSFSCECLVTNAVRPGTALVVEGVWDKFMKSNTIQYVTNDAVHPRGVALAKGRVIPFNDTLVEVKKA